MAACERQLEAEALKPATLVPERSHGGPYGVHSGGGGRRQRASRIGACGDEGGAGHAILGRRSEDPGRRRIVSRRAGLRGCPVGGAQSRDDGGSSARRSSAMSVSYTRHTSATESPRAPAVSPGLSRSYSNRASISRSRVARRASAAAMRSRMAAGMHATVALALRRSDAFPGARERPSRDMRPRPAIGGPLNTRRSACPAAGARRLSAVHVAPSGAACPSGTASESNPRLPPSSGRGTTPACHTR